MALHLDDIARIARLARLSFDADASAQLRDQMNGFFQLVESMQAVDTAGIEPLAHPFSAVHEVALHLADDQVLELDNRQANMHNAPAQQDGVFLVPRVIE